MANPIIPKRPVEQPCCGGQFVKNDLIYGRGTSPQCVDTAVDILTNGDFDDNVPPATGGPGTWFLHDVSTVPPASIQWDAGGTIQVRIGAPDDGAGSTKILAYDVFDGMTYTPDIDSSVDQTFSMDLTSVAVRSGKLIMLTLVDYTNGKYIQIDLSAEPYGTYTNTFVPADWTVGVAPNIGTFWYDGAIVSIFMILDDTASGGFDDDYDIDNVSLTHIECL